MLNLRKLIQDKDLTKRFETIKKVMREDYLPVWYIHCPHYTDHGSAHCEGVEAKLNELIPDDIKKELNEYEIFFLLSAVWLHDVGMTGFDDYEGFTREKHHELGRALIRKDQIKGISLDEHEKMVLGELVFGHCAPINEIEETTRIERKNKKNETIKIRFLACLLRLADVCDASHNRASGVILACKGVNPISKVHHELHQRVSSIEFDNNLNKIIVYAMVKSEKDKEILEKTIINDIQQELCTSSKILHPKITYNFVDLKISYDKFKNEITLPVDFDQQLQSHFCFECAKKLGPSQICEQIHQKNSDIEHKIEHFDDVATKKSKIPLLFGSSDLVKLKETFSSRWITTFNVIETLSFKDIKNSLEEGLPAIIVGNRDSGKTSFVYEMLKTFLLNNWHVAVYEKDESLDEEDFKTKSPLLIAVDDLHAFEIPEQDQIFKIYKNAIKNKCGFLVTYRLENENDIGHLWINEMSQINTKCVLPDLSKKELKQIIEAHSKERGVAINDENIEQFAWQVSKYSNMPAHIAYSFLSKEKGDTFSSDDIKKIPQKLNELIESIIMKLDKYGEKVMASFKIFNIFDGGDSRFVFKEELKYVFSKVNDGLSDVDFSRGINSLLKLGIIQEIDSAIFTTPKTGFLDQISLEFDNISINTMKNELKINYINTINKINLEQKEHIQSYSIALLSMYDRMEKTEIPIIDFINILVLKNIELARIVVFKKVFNEPKTIQKNMFKLILPYLKKLNDKKLEDLFQLAIAYEYMGEISDEVAILNEILLKNPRDANAHHRLGHIFSRLDRHSQAIEHMEKAANRNPKYLICLSNIQRNAGNINRAIEFTTKLEEYDPKDAQAYHELGHVFSEAKKHSQAIEYMEKAANLNSEYLYCLVDVYHKAGDIDKAIDIVNKAIEHKTENAFHYYVIGQVFSEAKKHSQAIEYMEKAANLDSKYLSNLVDVYHKAGDIDKAIDIANKAIEHNPGDASVYHILGHIFLDSEKQSQAIEYMEKAANLDSKYLYCLVNVYHKTGDIDKAIDIANKAIEHKTENAFHCYVIGQVFSGAKKHSQAIEYTEKAANLDSKYLNNLADIYYKAGDFDKAIDTANKAIDYDPKGISVYYILGNIYADELHNYTEAIKYYNNILVETPESNLIKTNLIEAFLGDGRYDDINIYATEILESSKDDNLNLNVKFIVLCSKFFQKGEINRKRLISDFIEYYISLPDNLENNWNYKGIVYLIEKSGLSNENDGRLLISLIDLLEKNIPIDMFKRNFLK